MAALQIVMENQLAAMDLMSASEIQNQMVRAGFAKLAATLSLRLLEKRGFMEAVSDSDINGGEWWSYRVTPTGIDWLLEHQNLFQLHARESESLRRPPRSSAIDEDDVPF